MKIKILFFSLISILLLNSCEQSKIGFWTQSDKEACVADALRAIKDDENFKLIKTFVKFNDKEFGVCICEKLEDKYESFAEADSKAENEMSEEQMKEFFTSCLGKDFNDMMEGFDNMEPAYEEGD